MPAEKPPLGIMPEYIWKLRRIDDLKATIQRYVNAGWPPRDEWYTELGKLLQEEMNRVK